MTQDGTALARHSDVRLSLGVYTHVELHDQTAVIGALPGPPANGHENGEKPRNKTA